MKNVEISIDDRELVDYFAQLAVFAAASSTDALKFSACGDQAQSQPETRRVARGCFKHLKMLRTFEQHGSPGPANFVEVLSELPSPQLTLLSLRLDSATMPTMQQIARFQDLQQLQLTFDSASLQFLEPLFELKELTHLVVGVNIGEMQAQHGASLSAIRKRAARLKAAILEYADLVGVKASVNTIGLEES